MNVSWKQVGCFFALTILLLALVPALSAITGASMNFDETAAQATEKTGIEQTSNLVTVIRLCLVEPGLWLLVLGSSVPSLAALAVVAWSGPGALKSLFGRFHPFGLGCDRRQGAKTYGIILMIFPLGLLSVFALRTLLPGPGYAQPDGLFGPGLIVALLFAAFLDQGALLEELGWRGYGQNAIQSTLLNPLSAAILVGVLWGLWHVPRDVVSGVIVRLGLMQYLFLFLPSFLLGTVTVSILAAYFANRCGGSLWPAIMIHGLTNDASGLSGMASIETALTPYHQLTKAIPFVFFALIIAVTAGRELGRSAQE